MDGLPRMNPRPRARLDADGNNQAVEAGDRHQRRARLHAVTLCDWYRRDDPVERCRQRLQRPVRAFPLQRIERRLCVGDGLIGLGKLVPCRKLLSQKLGRMIALLAGRSQRTDRLLIGGDRGGRCAEVQQPIAAADGLARRDAMASTRPSC